MVLELSLQQNAESLLRRHLLWLDLSLQRGTARLHSWPTAILGIYECDLPAVVTSYTINVLICWRHHHLLCE